MKKHEYPKWLYAEGKEPRLVESEEAHEQAGAGWNESPVVEGQEQDETASETAGAQIEAPKDTKTSEEILNSKTVGELRAELIARGYIEKDVKKMSKDELVVAMGVF